MCGGPEDVVSGSPWRTEWGTFQHPALPSPRGLPQPVSPLPVLGLSGWPSRGQGAACLPPKETSPRGCALNGQEALPWQDGSSLVTPAALSFARFSECAWFGALFCSPQCPLVLAALHRERPLPFEFEECQLRGPWCFHQLGTVLPSEKLLRAFAPPPGGLSHGTKSHSALCVLHKTSAFFSYGLCKYLIFKKKKKTGNDLSGIFGKQFGAVMESAVH